MTDILNVVCMEMSNSTKSNIALTIDGLSKSYGEVKVIRSLSFTAEKGEIFGIIGPDGAGKTTLFRILTTLILADKGSATIEGMDIVKDYKQIRQHIGYMPGKFSLYQDMTVEENLKFFATLFGNTIKDNYDLIKDIYQQIKPFKKRRAGKLSGGRKQKLALSCALIHRPTVLFLDEPTTGVDPVSRKEFWDILQKLRNDGMTIVAATPYIDEIKQCGRVTFIDKGKICGNGTPEEILTEFSDIFCPSGLEHNNKDNTNDDVIVVNDLCKTFGTFHAVDHISFSVHRGEIFGFLGANGAGKTTAMRMLTGLSQPTSGEGTVAGYDVSTQYEEIKKHIGYMSQKFSLYEDLKVWENIRLFGGIYGLSDSSIAEKTAHLLSRLGMSRHRDTIVKELPLGWKQKLAFSVAIFHRSEER